MPQTSRVLKWSWIALALGAWFGWIYLATHQSKDASVLGRWSPSFFAFLATWTVGTLAVTLLLWEGPRRALLRHRGRLLGLCLGGVLALGATEIALRVIDPLGFNYLTEMKRYIGMRQDDPTLVYTQPRDQTVELDGVTVRFNELGLRGAPIGPKAPGEKRVLFLGDSVVFGWGVEEPETFVDGLAQRLSEADGATWRGINAGVCSYNSEQEERYLRERGFALEPDLVVLVFIDNDVLTYSDQWKEAAARAKQSPLRKFQALLRQTHTFQFVSHALENGLGGIQLEGAERRVQRGDEGWLANMEALTRMRSLCEERGVPLAAFHFRWRPNAWSDVLLEDARKALAPTPLVDTSDWFSGPLRGWVNSPTDSHPNARAHALTAQRMQEALQAQGIAP